MPIGKQRADSSSPSPWDQGLDQRVIDLGRRGIGSEHVVHAEVERVERWKASWGSSKLVQVDRVGVSAGARVDPFRESLACLIFHHGSNTGTDDHIRIGVGCLCIGWPRLESADELVVAVGIVDIELFHRDA